MGGLGAGCICLNGHGGLQDFSIRHKPHFSAMPPERNNFPDAAFALLRTGGADPVTRLVEGPLPDGKVYDQGLWTAGQDTHRGGFEGLPRFRRSRFSSGYPFGRVALSDPKVPLTVEITGWSPFIPLDDVASGIPCVILEYKLTNETARAVDFEFSYHLSHLAIGAEGAWPGARTRVTPGKGVFFYNTEPKGADSFGSASLTTIGHRPRIKGSWPDGGWFDVFSRLWKEVKLGKFKPNTGEDAIGRGARKGGSMLVGGRLGAGRSVSIPVVIAWHFPNSSFRSYGWFDRLPPNFVPRENEPAWRPFYASQWADAAEVASHVHRNYDDLRERTVAFQNALLSSTLPSEILDAVSANLAIVKSPTILRQENGNLWGWEGCGITAGSCSGTCTHVWNYAQALPHLFPALERTLREQEYRHSMDERGHVSFRASLPDGPAPHVYHAAADGQLGGILKLFRDWQISGDTDWLRRLYPLARRSLEYGITTWDPGRRGALVEPHHNTYDIEFWGAEPMCGSIYQAALAAMAAMACALGQKADAEEYESLSIRAARCMEDQLFNGEYFIQKIQYRGLRDKSFLERLEQKKDDAETQRMLRKEGPNYQYGTGCLSDGVIGAWMAEIYGVKAPLDRAKVRKNLLAIYRHNYRRSLVGHENTQRPGYAMEDEGGLLLCSWPRGGKPTLPFIYSDEVWTGIEYQVASHLASEGFLRQSLDIVRSARKRYDGKVRNPWNEYECGSYYARAMASYALLASWSGFRYSAVEKTLWFGPPAKTRKFQTFFSTASAYGTLALEGSTLTVRVLEGSLDLDEIVLKRGKSETRKKLKKRVDPARPLRVSFP